MTASKENIPKPQTIRIVVNEYGSIEPERGTAGDRLMDMFDRRLSEDEALSYLNRQGWGLISVVPTPDQDTYHYKELYFTK